MTHIWLVMIAVFATSLAQALLKKSSLYDVSTAYWIFFMGVSAVAYAISFILYSRILQYFPLNKVYPAMTVGQIILVTIYGLWIGEFIDLRHSIGLVFGLLSIYLILS